MAKKMVGRKMITSEPFASALPAMKNHMFT